MRRRLIITSLLLVLCVPGWPRSAGAQRNAREILSDHSAILTAGDLSLRFIYLHPDSAGTEVAKAVLTTEEFQAYEREKERLQKNWSLIAFRLVPYRDARFDPTLLRITARERTHQVGFMDVVDVHGMFMSTVRRGDYVFGFIKAPEYIDFRRTITYVYETYRTQFLLPLRWRQKYFNFLDSPGR